MAKRKEIKADSHRMIIERLGGPAHLANHMPDPARTVLRIPHWKKRNNIPYKRWDDVIAAADKMGFDLDFETLWETRVQR